VQGAGIRDDCRKKRKKKKKRKSGIRDDCSLSAMPKPYLSFTSPEKVFFFYIDEVFTLEKLLRLARDTGFGFRSRVS
jgi:hypothetical protein